MGTWGAANFENDGANDYLCKLLDQIIAEITENLSSEKLSSGSFLEDYGEFRVIPAIDVFVTLSEHYNMTPRVELETAAEWRQLYLDAFDRTDTMYIAKFKPERREAIEETFRRLESLILDWK